MHPVSCQDNPGYYRADGGYADVREVDRIGITQDGYFAVGHGVLENPNWLSNFNYKHPFISKLSLDGDLLYTKRYDLPDDTLSGFFSPIVSTNYLRGNDGTFPLIKISYNYSNTNFLSKMELVVFDYLGDTVESHFIQQEHIMTNIYQLIEDLSDSTYVWCGYYNDSTVNYTVGATGMLMKIGRDGQKIWEKKMPQFFNINNIEKIDHHRFFISGSNYPNQGLMCSDNWTMNLDYVYGIYDESTEQFTYFTSGGACGFDIAYPIVHDSTSVTLFGFNTSIDEVEGCSMSNGAFYTQNLTMNEGVLLPQQIVNFSHQCWRHSIYDAEKTTDDGFLVAGDCFLPQPAFSRGFLFKLNQNFFASHLM